MGKSKIIYLIGGYAPGNYMNKCVSCGDEFFGDKLSGECQPCAINRLNEEYTALVRDFVRTNRKYNAVVDAFKILMREIDGEETTST